MKTSKLALIAAARGEVRTYVSIQKELDQAFADGRVTGISYQSKSNALRTHVRERNNLAWMAMSHALVIGDWFDNETLERAALERTALAMLDVYAAIAGGEATDEAER